MSTIQNEMTNTADEVPVLDTTKIEAKILDCLQPQNQTKDSGKM